MIKIKNPEEKRRFTERDREIRRQWIDMLENGATEEEQKAFVKSLSDEEYGVFYSCIGVNPVLTRVKNWRNS